MSFLVLFSLCSWEATDNNESYFKLPKNNSEPKRIKVNANSVGNCRTKQTKATSAMIFVSASSNLYFGTWMGMFETPVKMTRKHPLCKLKFLSVNFVNFNQRTG